MNSKTNNFNFIDEKKFEAKNDENKINFIKAINDDVYLIKLIKTNIMMENKINQINDFKIIDICFDKHHLNLIFNADNNSLSKIREHYYMTKNVTPEDADNNFNKYKVNRYYLLPIDFEIKHRSFEHYKDYLLNELIKVIQDQLIFDFFKYEWGYEDAIYLSYLIYKEKIKPISDESKKEIIKKILIEYH